MKTCPFCNEPIDPAEETAACPACEIEYHTECWECTGACGACGAAEEAEEAPPEAPDPIARPLPGYENYDIILGGGFGGGTITSTTDPAAGVVVEAALGEVLLEVEGRSGSPGLLLAVVIAFPVVFLLPCLVFDQLQDLARLLPFTSSEGAFNAGAIVLLVVMFIALALVVRFAYENRGVTFTERGVVSRNSRAASFLAWDEIEGYRVQGSHVLLESPRDQIGVPIVGAEERGRVLQLLDERGVRRFD